MELNQPATMLTTGAIVAVPAVCMAIGSVAVSCTTPSEIVQGRMQYLSAGLLVGAVMTEIYPILKERMFLKVGPFEPRQVDWPNLLAALAGFLIGLALMYTIKSLDLEGEDEDEAPIAEDKGRARPPADSSLSEALLDGAGTPSEPGTPASQKQAGEFSILPANEEEGRALTSAVARLEKRAQALGQMAEAGEFDRDAADESVHFAEYYVDVARRACRGADNTFDQKGASRLRAHVGELKDRVAKLRALGGAPVKASVVDAQLSSVRRSVKRIHLLAHKVKFRRWAPRADDAQNVVAARIRRASSMDGMSSVVIKQVSDVATPLAVQVVEEEEEEPKGGVPWALVLAVTVDSLVDGMLIGLASAVTVGSGGLMALATAIEMGFLGYSFACTLTAECHRYTAAALSALPPVTMMCSALISAMSSSALQGTPAFAGLVAFALVALLFLVVQELLAEAQEKDGGELWHASIWLYLGLFLSVGIDVVVG